MSSINIGPCPTDETPHQLGSRNYAHNAIVECNRYKKLIRKLFGPEPSGTKLYVKSNEHDFGTYYELACWFQEDINHAKEYAYKVENEQPEKWDD